MSTNRGAACLLIHIYRSYVKIGSRQHRLRLRGSNILEWILQTTSASFHLNSWQGRSLIQEYIPSTRTPLANNIAKALRSSAPHGTQEHENENTISRLACQHAKSQYNNQGRKCYQLWTLQRFPQNGGRIFICNLVNQYQEFHKETFPSTEQAS